MGLAGGLWLDRVFQLGIPKTVNSILLDKWENKGAPSQPSIVASNSDRRHKTIDIVIGMAGYGELFEVV